MGIHYTVKTYNRDRQNTTVFPLITRRQMVQYSHKKRPKNWRAAKSGCLLGARWCWHDNPVHGRDNPGGGTLDLWG